MSTDHPTSTPSPLANTPPPAFLSVRPGNLVIIQAQQQVAQQESDDWWMGQVVFCEGGARDPRVNTMFQVSNVDDGGVYWVNGHEVTQILSSISG